MNYTEIKPDICIIDQILLHMMEEDHSARSKMGAAYAYYYFYNSSNSQLLRYFYDPRNVGSSNLYTGNAIDIGPYISQRNTYLG